MEILRSMAHMIACLVLAVGVCRPTLAQNPAAPQRTHLILKDGSYQIVLDYKVVGKNVRFVSAERNGEIEDIPLALVDLTATERWKTDHAHESRATVLSPELAREEEERSSRTPEVASDLRLPEEESVLALDTFQSAPELVPVPQEGSDLNKETAHDVQRKDLNPLAAAHQILQIAGPNSDVQLHIATPKFYVHIGMNDDAEADPGGGAFTVDTHGAAGRATPSGGAAESSYVIERLDVRKDMRVMNSFRIAQLGTGKKQPDIIEIKQETLAGGHWMNLTPAEPLEPGEYALIEVLNDHQLNLNLWDFGVNAKAAENMQAIRPEVRKPVELKNRQ